MAKDFGIFDLPPSNESPKLVLIAAPFEATTSYLGGTSKAPQRIHQASCQVDLDSTPYGKAYSRGIAMVGEKASKKIQSLNSSALKLVRLARKSPPKAREKICARVDKLGSQVNEVLGKEIRKHIDAGKIVGVVGGDHSVPFANIAETLSLHPKMGVLHLDAHHDLRRAYEDFTWSHASIFYNVMSRLPLQRLVQIGIRDFCDEERSYADKRTEMKIYYDSDLFAQKSKGVTWDRICDSIIGDLPNEVYLSFDIDGLDPALCPSTGTAVPGGLSFNELTYLIHKLVLAKKTIVGFDLVEVGTTEWDANVGARILYHMCLAALASQKS